MLQIAKMDIFRLFRSTSFFVCLAFMLMMGLGMSMGTDGITLDSLLGISTNVDAGDAFMTSLMGSGVISIMLGIIVSLFIHSDFSSGYIKNIFSVRSNIKDYFFGKLLSFGLISLLMQVLYLVLSCIILLILAGGISLSGTILALLFFIFEKWLLSFAFIAMVLFIMLLTRKGVWGIIAGFIIGTGGLSMMIPGLATMIGLPVLNILYAMTISGTAKSMMMTADLGQLGQVALVSVAWIACLSIVTIFIAKKKDIL